MSNNKFLTIISTLFIIICFSINTYAITEKQYLIINDLIEQENIDKAYEDLNKMADGLIDDAKINTILGFYAAAALAPSATTIISDTVTPALSQIAESAVQAGVAAISAVPLVGTAVALPNAIGWAWAAPALL